MKDPDLSRWLADTLADRRLSRGERRALTEALAEDPPSEHRRLLYLSQAFELAREVVSRRQDRRLLEWLHEVVKMLLGGSAPASTGDLAECCFAPQDDCAERLRQLIEGARRSLDVSVFTITDNRLSGALLAAHDRGVRVRILTDDEKALDRGSDIRRLSEAGIALRTDRSADLMHHKFALVDRRLLVTGSYNWTRSASHSNYENFLITDDPRLAGPFMEEFERLWKAFDQDA